MAMALHMIREADGKLPAYAWPGGYPIFYLAADNGVLCTKCANAYNPDTDTAIEEARKTILAQQAIYIRKAVQS